MINTNSDIIVLIISACLVFLLLLIFIVAFMFIYNKRQLGNELALKHVREKYDQEILKTQLEIREQTLKTISEEIHDNMGQVLSVVVLSLSAIEFTDPELDASRIENSTKLVKRVINDLRNLSKTMDAENMARVGLPAIIRYELELLDKSGLYRTFFDCQGQEYRLEPSRETVVYRIVQESLNNVLKHARASEVRIMVVFEPDNLRIGISDNGVGFDVMQQGGDGAGLKNMKKRIALIGGSLNIVSEAGAGTRLELVVPVRMK
jgi:two-component system, NarL family, sensor kinase